MTIATTELPPAAVEPEFILEDSSQPTLSYSWFVVAFLMVLYTSSFIDRQILALLIKPIRSDFQIDDFQYGLLTGLAFVGTYALAGLPIGVIVDRWSRKGVILIGVTAWSLMTAACGITQSFSSLFLTRIGVGIGEATLSPASYSLISDLFPKEKLGKALSLYGLGIPIGSGLALIIGGQVVAAIEKIGSIDFPVIGMTRPWQTVFLAIGLPGLLLSLLTILVVREPKRHTPRAEIESKPTIGEALVYFWRNIRAYAGLFMGMGLLAMFGYGCTAFYPAFLERVFGLSVADASLFLGVATLVFGVAGCMFGGWLSDRLLAKGHPDAHYLVSVGYCLAFAVTGAIGSASQSAWVSLPLVAISLAFSNTIIGVVAAALQILTPVRMRGLISSLFLAVAAFVGFAFGPSLIGFITSHIFHDDNMIGYSLAIVAAIFPTLGAVAFWLGRKPLLEKVAAQ
jgi:MFS family permease